MDTIQQCTSAVRDTSENPLYITILYMYILSVKDISL